MAKSDGGSTGYYKLPAGAAELNDLIEHKNMPFALGNIFKACYRFGEKDSADRLYDINKIIFFALRLKAWELRKRGETSFDPVYAAEALDQLILYLHQPHDECGDENDSEDVQKAAL